MKQGNPFETMAERLRSMRQRFMGRLSNTQLLSPPVGELLGAIAGLINACEAAREQVDKLERQDPWACAAFERAINAMAEGKRT